MLLYLRELNTTATKLCYKILGTFRILLKGDIKFIGHGRSIINLYCYNKKTNLLISLKINLS